MVDRGFPFLLNVKLLNLEILLNVSSCTQILQMQASNIGLILISFLPACLSQDKCV